MSHYVEIDWRLIMHYLQYNLKFRIISLFKTRETQIINTLNHVYKLKYQIWLNQTDLNSHKLKRPKSVRALGL